MAPAQSAGSAAPSAAICEMHILLHAPLDVPFFALFNMLLAGCSCAPGLKHRP